MRAIAFASLLLAASAAEAQVALPFYDDFEDGGLATNTPQVGKWDYLSIVMGNDAGAVAAGSHTGSYGLRAEDALATADNGLTSVDLHTNIIGAPGDRYFREWVRVTTTATVARIGIGVVWDGVDSEMICGLGVGYPGAEIYVSANYGPGTNYFEQDAGVAMTSGVWRLLECAALDAGTSNVEIVLWVDGVERFRRSGFDHTGWYADQFGVGENIAASGTFLGTVDVDNAAVMATPPPSTLRVDAGAVIVEGKCTPVAVELVSSSGVSAPALWAEPLAVAVTGAPATIYGNGGCTNGAMPAIDVGQTQAVLGVVAASGSLTLTVQSADLIGASTTMIVSADAGTGPLDLAVSCGCEHVAWSGAGGALAVVLLRSRRRRASA